MPRGTACEMWGEGLVRLRVCGASLDDWANGGCADVVVTNVVSLRMVSMVLAL